MADSSEPAPYAEGVRVQWDELPKRLQSTIGARLGSPVIAAVTQPGGFSPALAARVTTAAGDHAFVKAVPPDRNPDSPEIYRQEVVIAARLPASLPVPCFLWSLDDGPGGWVVLAFEDLEGRHPRHPWDAADLQTVQRAMDELAVRLTPAPVEAPAAAEHFRSWRGWEALREQPTDLDDWTATHLETLSRLEAAAPAAVVGRTLLHMDLRADNILLTVEGARFFDWPWASIGAPWVDPLLFAPSVEMQGGPAAADVFAASAAGATAPHDAVVAALASFTGMLIYLSRQPPPPGLPTLRAFQAAQAAPSLAWLKRLVS